MVVWIALAALAVALIVLFVNHDGGTVAGLDTDTFAQLVALGALGAVIGAGVVRRARFNLGGSIKAAGIWILIGLGLVAAFAFRHDAETVMHRVLAELIPGYAITTGDGRVAVVRSNDGHFVLEARINGVATRLLVDTGASLVVLTPEDARRTGIDVDAIAYTLPVWTANGRTTAAPIRLERIEVGPLAVERVRAAVAQPGMLRESLLGMSFLERIPAWRVERDRLILGG